MRDHTSSAQVCDDANSLFEPLLFSMSKDWLIFQVWQLNVKSSLTFECQKLSRCGLLFYQDSKLSLVDGWKRVFSFNIKMLKHDIFNEKPYFFNTSVRWRQLFICAITFFDEQRLVDFSSLTVECQNAKFLRSGLLFHQDSKLSLVDSWRRF